MIKSSDDMRRKWRTIRKANTFRFYFITWYEFLTNATCLFKKKTAFWLTQFASMIYICICISCFFIIYGWTKKKKKNAERSISNPFTMSSHWKWMYNIAYKLNADMKMYNNKKKIKMTTKKKRNPENDNNNNKKKERTFNIFR